MPIKPTLCVGRPSSPSAGAWRSVYVVSPLFRYGIDSGSYRLTKLNYCPAGVSRSACTSPRLPPSGDQQNHSKPAAPPPPGPPAAAAAGERGRARAGRRQWEPRTQAGSLGRHVNRWRSVGRWADPARSSARAAASHGTRSRDWTQEAGDETGASPL